MLKIIVSSMFWGIIFGSFYLCVVKPSMVHRKNQRQIERAEYVKTVRYALRLPVEEEVDTTEKLSREFDLPNPTLEKFEKFIAAEIKRQEDEKKAILANIERALEEEKAKEEKIQLSREERHTLGLPQNVSLTREDVYEATRDFHSGQIAESVNYDVADGDGNIIRQDCTCDGCDERRSMKKLGHAYDTMKSDQPVKMIPCACGKTVCTSAIGCDRFHGHCGYGCGMCPHAVI